MTSRHTTRVIKGRRVPKVSALIKLRAQLGLLRKAKKLGFTRQRNDGNQEANDNDSDNEEQDMQTEAEEKQNFDKLVLKLAFQAGIRSINNPKEFVAESKDAMKEYLSLLIKDVVANNAAQAALA